MTMALHPDLLKILVDPLSRQPLELVEGPGGRTRLRCAANGLHYRIDDPDIPVLLIDEAQLADGSPAHELVAKLRTSASGNLGGGASRITAGSAGA